jgi:hypothetical protein
MGFVYALLLLVGFGSGYGVRELVSRHRPATLRRRYLERGGASYGGRQFRLPLSAAGRLFAPEGRKLDGLKGGDRNGQSGHDLITGSAR